MSGFRKQWEMPSADVIRKELVRTRCLSCRHECICAVVPGLKDTILFGLSCRQTSDSGKCAGLLRVISARGIAFHVFKIGAESYDVGETVNIPISEA